MANNKVGEAKDLGNDCPTVDIHIKKLPAAAWRIAKGASTIEDMTVAQWVAKAIFEKWNKFKKAH